MRPLSDSIDQLRTNAQQWEAFSTEGHCVVLAPPGSGKTKLLATRMAHDLATKIPKPHGAACVTLTNAAAAELRERTDTLGVRDRSNVFVGTVHSFALNAVVVPFATLVGRPELMQIRIASQLEEDTEFQSAVDSVYGTNTHQAKYVRSTIDFNRKRFATDEDWGKAGPHIREVANRYLNNLHQRGLVDFNELIEIAVDFVEHHSTTRAALTAKYPHFYVDEYQDLAPGLDRLVKALCFDYYRAAELFAVGDPDQAVFGFTGTRPELLNQLAQRTGVHPVTLQRNYRCGQEIVRIAHAMKHSKTPVVGNHDGGQVTVTQCRDGFAAQCAHAADRVSAIAQSGMPLHEIVIICPTNAQCDIAARVFRQRGIPVSFRNTDHYRLTQVTSFIEGCAAWAALGHESSNYRLADLLRQWRSILGQRAERCDDIALTGLLMDFAERGSEPAHQLASELHSAGLAAALKRPSLAPDAIEAAKMRVALATGSLRDLTVRGLADHARKTDRVEITTMNSSKGLEFDIVMILGMDQKRVPDFRSLDSAEKMAEERRKLYVSLTRARHEVHVYYSGFVEWRNRNERAGPSMFLNEAGLLQALT